MSVGEGFASQLQQRHILFKHQLGKDALMMVEGKFIKCDKYKLY